MIRRFATCLLLSAPYHCSTLTAQFSATRARRILRQHQRFATEKWTILPPAPCQLPSAPWGRSAAAAQFSAIRAQTRAPPTFANMNQMHDFTPQRQLERKPQGLPHTSHAIRARQFLFLHNRILDFIITHPPPISLTAHTIHLCSVRFFD